MSLELAVSKTLAYAKKYGCSLTREECGGRLIGNMIYDIRFMNRTFKKENDNKYFKNKLNLAKELVNNHLSKFDDILMVGVTGSVASKYPHKEDDVDLMIITKTNKLWLTRFKLKVYLVINNINHRKYEEKHEKNKFCFNLWMDESDLELPKSKKNLKNAVDSVLMIPLINKHRAYEKFLVENSWIKKYVATPYNKLITNYELRITNERFSMLNSGMFWIQYLYMKNKIRKEIVNYHQAFFHPKG